MIRSLKPSLFFVAALSMGNTAGAQARGSLTLSIPADVSTSCTIVGVSHDLTDQLRVLQSEADRLICLGDGAAFATDIAGEVRVSTLAPGADGEFGITDHFVVPSDTMGLVQACSIGPSPPIPVPYPNIGGCGVLEVRGDAWVLNTAQTDGEHFRRLLNIMMSLADGPDGRGYTEPEWTFQQVILPLVDGRGLNGYDTVDHD